MGKLIDLVGERFGRLVVAKLAFTVERGRKVWFCLCDCGGFKDVSSTSLRSGKTKSCGCLHKERARSMRRTHGSTSGGASRTYRIWSGILSRCRTPSATGYANYGGRGIKICERWLAFENFLDDMGECPEGYSIDRLNVDGDYCPENCRWTTTNEQARNTSRTRYVLVGGVRRVARDVAAENGISESAFKKRLYKYGWTLEEACGLVHRGAAK